VNASSSGAASVDSCVCKVGFMDNRTSRAAARVAGNSSGAPDGMPDCQQCVIGTDCSSDGITVDRLPLRRGFWRPSPLSTDVRAWYEQKRSSNQECP
jgi:hypothetical protein